MSQPTIVTRPYYRASQKGSGEGEKGGERGSREWRGGEGREEGEKGGRGGEKGGRGGEKGRRGGEKGGRGETIEGPREKAYVGEVEDTEVRDIYISKLEHVCFVSRLCLDKQVKIKNKKTYMYTIV